MRGFSSSVMPIMAGVRTDVERLLRLYKEKGSLKYKQFASLFESMQFATIFVGRMSVAELTEFSEKLLQMAISYAMSVRVRPQSMYLSDEQQQSTSAQITEARVNNEMTLQERMFGVYLAYSLYYVQPDDYVCLIRVTPDQMADLTEFIKEQLMPERHIDTVACLIKLAEDGAFRTVVSETEYNPLLQKRFDHIELAETVIEESEVDHALLRSIADDVIMVQADLVFNRYKKAKENPVFSSFDIDLVKSSVLKMTEKTLKEIERPVGSESSVENPQAARHLDRSSIRQRAYRSSALHTRERSRRQRASLRRSLRNPSVSEGASSPLKPTSMQSNDVAESASGGISKSDKEERERNQDMPQLNSPQKTSQTKGRRTRRRLSSVSESGCSTGPRKKAAVQKNTVFVNDEKKSLFSSRTSEFDFLVLCKAVSQLHRVFVSIITVFFKLLKAATHHTSS
ncbi:hypothetical protein AB6A40_006696 [Gnathostoma spinigerum]|uniref:Uncharacterized protein n=1 Tax=Gnathostoma spinigerum TaxID=75299 RepID=A0ABD6ETV9_9BILA